MAYIKFNVNLSREVYGLLASVADERGQTMADVLRDEIGRAAWMDDELRVGHNVPIQRGDSVAELVFPHRALLRKDGRPAAFPLEGPVMSRTTPAEAEPRRRARMRERGPR